MNCSAALSNRAWPGKQPAQSPGTNIDQQRRAILAGKPATYNKGFARKDFAV
jgi:hypothetical protein